MNLMEYEWVKFELASILRSATIGVSAEQPKTAPIFNDLFARLAEDRFNLVLVGRFNRGKTSLMNAMLHTDRLPVGVVPVTSVITTVQYGSSEEATIEYRDRQLPDRVSLDELTDYVSQAGNPSNERGITMARVSLPSESCATVSIWSTLRVSALPSQRTRERPKHSFRKPTLPCS